MPTFTTRVYNSNPRHDTQGVRFGKDPSNPTAEVTGESSPRSLPTNFEDAKWAVWYKIPTGSMEIRFKLKKYCGEHSSCIQVFHSNTGNLLVGTPFSLAPYRDTVSWDYPHTQLYTNQYHFDPLRKQYTSFDDYLNKGNWGRSMFPMWMLVNPKTVKTFDTTEIGKKGLVAAYNVLHGVGSYTTDLAYDQTLFSTLPPRSTDPAISLFNDKFAVTLGKVLSDLFPSVFPPIFVPKDSLVNGTGYPYFKKSDSLQLFNVEGETIYWTGNTLAGLSGDSGDVEQEVPVSSIPNDAVTYNGHSFKVYTASSITWPEAEHKCEQRGGHLAVITDAGKQSFVHSLLPSDAWIGGMRHDYDTSTWMWINNDPWNYTNWNTGEPNDTGTGESCTEMFKSTGLWNDLPDTSTLKAYVCEWDDEPVINVPALLASEGVNVVYEPLNGHYYGTFEESTSWAAAASKCKSLGGCLISLEDWIEVTNSVTLGIPHTSGDSAGNEAKNIATWTGLKYTKATDSWSWESGAPFDSNSFGWSSLQLDLQTGKFNLDGDRYLVVIPGGGTPRWRLVDATEYIPRYFICEWEFDPRELQPVKEPKITNHNYEELYIPEAHCELIVGIISTHWFEWEASWQERTDPPPDPCVYHEPEPIPDEPEPEPIPDEPEPDEQYTYKFHWNPAYDLRLPSTVAKNADYNTFYPIEWRTTEEDKDGNIIYKSSLPEEIQDYDAYSVQWLTHLLRAQNGGQVVASWEHLHDELAINLTNFPLLGPILPEYQPSITAVGAKVMVSCTNVQLYQASFDMKVWVGADVIKDPEELISYYRKFLYQLLVDTGYQEQSDRYTLYPGEGGPLVTDYFPMGKDKFWWIETKSTYLDGKEVDYEGAWLHQKVYFNYPFPVSSVVTLYPDLGAVEGISHIGSALVCAVPGSGDPGDPWMGYWPEYESLNQIHLTENNFYPVGIMAEEADILLFLRKNNYLIPANVLTWSDQVPWSVAEGTPVPDAFKAFFTWWWTKVYPTQKQTNAITRVRELQPKPVLSHTQWAAYMREDQIWATRRDSALNAINVSSQYVPSAVFYPWSIIEDVTGSCAELCNGTIYITTAEKILRGKHLLYWLTSRYRGRIIGEGTDIFMGKVVKNKEKIVEVKFSHHTTPYVKMKRIRISVIPDADYPYYQFVELSLDGTVWSDTIYHPNPVVSPHIASLTNQEDSFVFYVKVVCGSTLEDPKPVKIQVNYERSL